MYRDARVRRYVASKKDELLKGVLLPKLSELLSVPVGQPDVYDHASAAFLHAAVYGTSVPTGTGCTNSNSSISTSTPPAGHVAVAPPDPVNFSSDVDIGQPLHAFASRTRQRPRTTDDHHPPVPLSENANEFFVSFDKSSPAPGSSFRSHSLLPSQRTHRSSDVSETDAYVHVDVSFATSSDHEELSGPCRIIQRAWRRFLNRRIFRYFRDLIVYKQNCDSHELLRHINPREAQLLDLKSGFCIRFRLGGCQFPPLIYYKVYTTQPVADIGAFAPRDYTQEKGESASVRARGMRSVTHMHVQKRTRTIDFHAPSELSSPSSAAACASTNCDTPQRENVAWKAGKQKQQQTQKQLQGGARGSGRGHAGSSEHELPTSAACRHASSSDTCRHASSSTSEHDDHDLMITSATSSTSVTSTTDHVHSTRISVHTHTHAIGRFPGVPSDVDTSRWYRRWENNGWRLVADRLLLETDPVVAETHAKSCSPFHFSRMVRQEDVRRKVKQKKREWLRNVYVYVYTIRLFTCTLPCVFGVCVRACTCVYVCVYMYVGGVCLFVWY